MFAGVADHHDTEWLKDCLVKLETLYRGNNDKAGMAKAVIRRKGHPSARDTYGAMRQDIADWYHEKKIHLTMPQSDPNTAYVFGELLDDEELAETMRRYGSDFEPESDDREDTLDDLVIVYEQPHVDNLLRLHNLGQGERRGEGGEAAGEASDDETPGEDDEGGAPSVKSTIKKAAKEKKKSDLSAELSTGQTSSKATAALLKALGRDSSGADALDRAKRKKLEVSLKYASCAMQEMGLEAKAGHKKKLPLSFADGDLGRAVDVVEGTAIPHDTPVQIRLAWANKLGRPDPDGKDRTVDNSDWCGTCNGPIIFDHFERCYTHKELI